MDRRLYEEDFFLWSQEQAAALRAEASRRGGGSNALDWELLAEEVSDLGGSQLRECLSRTRTIIEHLIKVAASACEEPKPGWRTTIRTQRADLALALTPSIRRVVEERLEGLHQRAMADVAAGFADLGEAFTLNETTRWSLAAILGEEEDNPAG